MDVVLDFLRKNPSLLLFVILAGGYALGKVKVKGFGLGSTTSVLLIGIVVGAIVVGNKTHYDLGILKTVSFSLFIFGVGYKVGPDFINGLKHGGFKFGMVAIFFAVAALITAVILGRLFHFGPGYSAGMLGGALTQSAVIGTADTALKHLSGVTPTAEINLQSEVAVAYAVTYIFGTAGLIIFLKALAILWKVDFKKSVKDAQKLVGNVGDTESIEDFQWSNLAVPRAYILQNEELTGKLVKDVENSFFSGLVSIDKILREDKVIDDVQPQTELDSGDKLLLIGQPSEVLEAGKIIGKEVDNSAFSRLIGELLEVCLTNKALEGKTIKEVLGQYGRGCYVRSLKRQGHDLKANLNVKLHLGDTLEVMGEKDRVDDFAKIIGYAERSKAVTDLVMVGIGIVLGTLLGLVAIPIGGIPITLGIGGGVLVSGLFFGWLRSLRPTWGQIPSSAMWIFTDLGLNLFIACVGLSAGPKAVMALHQAGGQIFFAGALLTIIPHLLTWLFGYHVIKLNPVLLLGAMTGAGTCTAALKTVKEDSNSVLPVIGYTVPYAIGNVLLTVWGAIIVHLF
ncbi:MAG: aspartate:alanine exchanger family transporter [Chlamydiota bacterium]